MIVVSHQHVAVNDPSGPVAGLPQGGDKYVSIYIISENHFFSVSPAHHVITGPGIFDSWLAWHGGCLSGSGEKGTQKLNI
jgi:hypothetical protein